MAEKKSTVLHEDAQHRYVLDTYRSAVGIISSVWRWDFNPNGNGMMSVNLFGKESSFPIRRTQCGRITAKRLAEEHELAMAPAKATVEMALKRLAEVANA